MKKYSISFPICAAPVRSLLESRVGAVMWRCRMGRAKGSQRCFEGTTVRVSTTPDRSRIHARRPRILPQRKSCGLEVVDGGRLLKVVIYSHGVCTLYILRVV